MRLRNRIRRERSSARPLPTRFLCFDAPSNEIAVPDELLKSRRVFGNSQILYENAVLTKEVGHEKTFILRHREVQDCAGHFVFLGQNPTLRLLRLCNNLLNVLIQQCRCALMLRWITQKLRDEQGRKECEEHSFSNERANLIVGEARNYVQSTRLPYELFFSAMCEAVKGLDLIFEVRAKHRMNT